jgi:hypothetical protein
VAGRIYNTRESIQLPTFERMRLERMKDKILHYLANGLAASQVATLVGCSPAYISQLLATEEFKAELRAKILDNPASVDEKLEDKYSAVEHALVNAVQEAIPGAELPAISRALETVARIRHDRYVRKNPALLQPTVNVQYVQLTMPNHIVRHSPIISLNEKSEITAIDNQPMAPLSSDGVKNLFTRMRESQNAVQIGATI